MNGQNNNGFNDDILETKDTTTNNDTSHRITLNTINLLENEKKQENYLEEIAPVPNNNNSLALKFNNFQKRNKKIIHRCCYTLVHVIVVGYFAWATYHHFYLKDNHWPELVWPPPPSSETTTTTAPGTGNNDDENNEPIGRCPTYCGIQWCNGYGMLIILVTIIYAALIYYYVIKRYFGEFLDKSCISPITQRISKIFKYRLAKLVLAGIVLAGVITFIVLDTTNSRNRLQSLAGIFILFGLGYIFSKDRSKINFQPVIVGFTFQFLLGVICIRWDVGRNIFACIGDKVAMFLTYSDEGSSFVYGDFLIFAQKVFAFQVLSVIFFVSFCISILYYWGVMQFVVEKLGWALQKLLGTTVCESVVCAANIFIGMSESPLLVRPYIKLLTPSELHAIMTSGFATVSGTVLAAYISYGAEPAHLVTSSVMAAPAALCFSKLFYPETEESKTKSENMKLEKSTDSSVLDAASNGAGVAIQIVLGIIANIVAFVSFIAFLNGVVNWLAFLVGYDEITFEWLLGKLFIPLAWILGVEWDDCENVGHLIATKTIINEFVAYERLGKMKDANLITLRSSAIATYAVCGFANPSSVGIVIASLSALAPEKRSTIISVIFRAFISGCTVCFITACISGLLMDDDIF